MSTSSEIQAVPEPTIVDGDFVPTRTVPYSNALDEMIAEVRAGNAPNLGRFCGYCCTPLRKRMDVCPSCETSVDVVPARDKISRSLGQIYTEKRKKEARLVHGAAWAGLIFGTAISVGLIMVLPGLTKILAVVFMILGSYLIATYLGNYWIQDRAYRSGLRFFAQRWQQYLVDRESGELEDD